MKKKRPVTQAEIAKEVGISQAAVSVILSGSESLNVSPETRKNVLKLAQELGYSPRNPGKSASRKPSSHNVLLVETSAEVGVDRAWMSEAYDTLMGKIVTASEQRLRQHDLGLNFIRFEGSEHLMRWMQQKQIGGVLWHAIEKDSPLLHWVASRAPLVLLNREWRAAESFDSVSVDQELNITIAADKLWSLGHRKIATFGQVPGSSIHTRRLSAYKRFVEEKGLRNYSEFQKLPDDREGDALEKVASILNLWKEMGREAPTALITTDKFALYLIQEATKAGLRIPEDLSVIGIDNTSVCSYVDPALTSMDEPFAEMCRVAVDLLVRRMVEPDAPSQAIQVAPRLVERKSVLSLLPEGEAAEPQHPGPDLIGPSTLTV